MDGVVAQLVERLVRNEKVRGSTPLDSTTFKRLLLVAKELALKTDLHHFHQTSLLAKMSCL